ncbi:hypothetical protein N0V86_008505 [Didymella sp. IMI 355093]|nr:hypothetical protein N0V86_008505 [Didymella sp. IMI 355093]
MSKMQTFVKGPRNGRPESPYNGQPQVNPQRALQAANLKVSMRPEVARPGTAQGLHGRSESIAQNQPASLQQQHLPRQPADEGRKRDPYDTDAESIDTTVNHSVIQVEDTQPFDQQQFQPDDEELESGGDEDAEAYGEDLEDNEYDIADDVRVQEYLVQHGKSNASYDEQIHFLQTSQPQLFRTVDGDSYPTTTEGNPTEVDEQLEQPADDPDSPSPSPQRLAGQGHAPSMLNQQPQQSPQALDMHRFKPATQQSSRLYQQGAQIRGQQRREGAAHVRGQPGQQHVTFEPSTSQPPSYSQSTRQEDPVAPLTTHTRLDVIAQGVQMDLSQRSKRLPSVPRHSRDPIPRIEEPAMTSKRTPATRTNVVPIVQQPIETTPFEPAPIEERPKHVGDYGPEDLSKMRYEELRDESFDQDPHEQEPALPEDMLEKTLDERLIFAQEKLDPSQQAKFFTGLPTTEWEEAGDWFLAQFSTIIARTRAARQKKRKQAREFESEIEKRHKHVAKKQCLVEDAMAKMQAQGEGLVPKSPRASKSPRPRRA